MPKIVATSFQSSDSPATLAFDRSRSTMASSPAISSALVSCSTSQLRFSQSRKLTLISDQEDFLALQHAAQEMVLGAELRAKFGARIDRGIHFSADSGLRARKRIGSLCKRHVANYHDIHVACPALPSLRNRAVDKSHVNTPCEWCKRGPQGVRNAPRLYHEAPQLCVDRRVLIRFEVHL